MTTKTIYYWRLGGWTDDQLVAECLVDSLHFPEPETVELDSDVDIDKQIAHLLAPRIKNEDHKVKKLLDIFLDGVFTKNLDQSSNVLVERFEKVNEVIGEEMGAYWICRLFYELEYKALQKTHMISLLSLTNEPSALEPHLPHHLLEQAEKAYMSKKAKDSAAARNSHEPKAREMWERIDKDAESYKQSEFIREVTHKFDSNERTVMRWLKKWKS